MRGGISTARETSIEALFRALSVFGDIFAKVAMLSGM